MPDATSPCHVPLRTASCTHAAAINPHPLSLDSSVRLARHTRAALLHLTVVDDLLQTAGADRPAPTSPVAHLLQAARAALEDLDRWAWHTAYHAGADHRTYDHMDRWCPTPGGVLPTSTPTPRPTAH